MLRATLVLGLLCFAVCDAAIKKRKEEDKDGEGDRIVGGTTCLISDAPSIVSFQRRNVHICGGTIVSPFHILTACHCIRAFDELPINQASIRAGSTLWSANGDKMGVKGMLCHPKYNKTSKVYDIGLLKLVAPLVYDDVTTQEAVIADKIPRSGMDCKINGWGLKKENDYQTPNMLQKANIKAISREECASEMFKYGENAILEGMICGQNPGIDACQGDSGGPFYCRNSEDSPYILYGVVSFGRGCGRKDFPGVYITTASVRKWIAHYLEYM